MYDGQGRKMKTHLVGKNMEKKEMKKIIPILIGVLLITSLAPIISSDTTNITGTFDPSTTLSASLNDSTFAWGSISTDETKSQFGNLSNDGDVNIDVTIQHTANASDLSLSPTSAPGQDEYNLTYSLNGFTDESGWDEKYVRYAATSLETNVPAAGESSNYTAFAVNITMGPSFSENWGEQSITIQLAYTEHT